jgi:hypothetical protein
MKVRQRDRAQLLGQVPLFSYCSQREAISAHNLRPLLMTSPEIQFKPLEALAERLAPSTSF